MNSIRKWIRDVFGFSGNEINGFLILIPLVVVAIFSEPLYHRFIASRQRQYPDDAKALDSLIASWKTAEKTAKLRIADSLFDFDPNTARLAELRCLGFSENSAKRIAAYRLKGGVFRIKSDIMKIYGLDSTLYKQLYRYIRLPAQHVTTSLQERPSGSRKREVKTNTRFDINSADTVRLKTVFGIGSKLAARIVKFRDALGGFVNNEQLYEVYGLDSVVVKRLFEIGFIKPDFAPEKININTAVERELSGHPYIRYRIARALMSYRFQHGDFMDVNDIKKLSAIPPEELDRLLPYLKVSD
jgi:DNA uptake protein ComE-like DNA-binding protein